jgi:phosphoenolpyruvate synthase/pyruvate phosphate dikinase
LRSSFNRCRTRASDWRGSVHINNAIGVHPKAVLDYPNLDAELKQAVESLAHGYPNPRAFFEMKLAEGIATIAAAFWPKPVIVRMSDFKSNEYKRLIGGSRYEPDEENPMLGFRGASRYIADSFRECFRMEAAALKVRDDGVHQRRDHGAVQRADRSEARNGAVGGAGLKRGPVVD